MTTIFAPYRNSWAIRMFRMESIKASSVFGMVLVLVFFVQGNATADGRWFVSFYGGQATDGTVNDVFTFKANYVDSYICVFVVGKKLSVYKDYICIEVEGQIVKHWELQDHLELNGVFVFRWLPFPWDYYVDTSFGIGDGISYATKDPEIEVQKMDETSRVLHYLMFEFAFVVPKHPHWAVFARLHHRSGVFGLINGVSGGSNIVGAGVRYTF